MSLRPLPFSSSVCMDVTFPCFPSFLFTTEVISIYYIRKQFIIRQELSLEFIIYHFQRRVPHWVSGGDILIPISQMRICLWSPSQGSKPLESTSSRSYLRQPVADDYTSDHLPLMLAESNQYNLANICIKYLLPETLRRKGNAYSLNILTFPSL